jgi:hypothetical protein
MEEAVQEKRRRVDRHMEGDEHLDAIMERVRAIIRAYTAHSRMSTRELSLRISPRNPALLRAILSGRSSAPRLDTVLGLAHQVGLTLDELVNVNRPMPDFASLEAREAAEMVDVDVVLPEKSGNTCCLRKIREPAPIRMTRHILESLAGPLQHAAVMPAPSTAHGIRSGDQLIVDRDTGQQGLYIGVHDGRLGIWDEPDEPLARIAAVVRRA